MSKTTKTSKSKRPGPASTNVTTNQNIGKSCLEAIASIWEVDNSAVKWVDRGFDCTPGSHLVRVRAVPNEGSSEGRWRVSVTTDFLISVRIEDLKFIEGTAAFAGVMTSTYSIQYPPAGLEGTIK